MVDTNITSLPAQSEIVLGAIKAIVKLLDTGEALNYSGTWNVWPNAQVVSITLKLGADPGEAILEIPCADAAVTTIGKVTDSKVHSAPDYGKNAATRLRAAEELDAKNYLFSRVAIYRAANEGYDNNLGKPIFVGYIVEYHWVGHADSTVMRVRLEDARHFARKAIIQGTIFRNIRANQTLYIRAHDPVMNEGNLPNRYVTLTEDQNPKPQFVNVNLNRFRDEPASKYDRTMIDDAEEDALREAGMIGVAGEPYAAKWLPGHAWNYLVRLHFGLINEIGSTVDQPTNTQLGHDPCADDFPVDLSDVMLIEPLPYNLGPDQIHWGEWFQPRALIANAQTGGTDAISGLGEWAPAGVPVVDALFDLCRRVGNFTLCPEYTESGLLILRPIRTTSAIGEITAMGPESFGNRYGPGIQTGGKAGEFTLPTSQTAYKDTRPEVAHWDIKHGAGEYHNRVYMKGGKRWIQLTLSTLGWQQWTDHLDQVHQAYNPGNEWVPNTATGGLVPGWLKPAQTEWLTLFDEARDAGAYPDVFRTWVIRDNLDWAMVCGQSNSEPGYRMFFERDRQILQHLLTRVYDRALGLFRSRPQGLPMMVWRAYQGIPINAAGDTTAYGGAATVGNPVSGKKRWFRCQATFIPITDGRRGFQLADDARRRLDYAFEDPDVVNGVQGPWAWNGQVDNPWAYEMFWTFAIEVDEDLWEFMVLKDRISEGGMPIKLYGPPMEIHRDAGLEYGEESVYDSVIDNPLLTPGSDGAGYRQQMPEPTAEGSRLREYRNGQKEIRARANLLLKRHAMTDLEGNLTLDHLALEIQAGEYIEKLTVPGDHSVHIGCIISDVVHDFIAQKTMVHIATVR